MWGAEGVVSQQTTGRKEGKEGLPGQLVPLKFYHTGQDYTMEEF